MDVRSWLRKLGLERYEEAFRANNVDGDVLPHLTADDLKDLGVRSVGHRRKLLEAIAELRKQAADAEDPGADDENVEKTESAGDVAVHRPERRQLTIMFVDLAGSTALSGRLDPEEMRDVITRYQNLVATRVARFDGYIAKYMGDGVLVYFGYPTAHEDDAERAVRAGIALSTAISKAAASDEIPVGLRVGIATGLVVVGDLIGEGAAREEGVVGETPNLAARLQGQAETGQVIVSETTRRLLGDAFAFEALGPLSLKGIDHSVQAFRVIGEQASESRFEAYRAWTLSPMFGRRQEFALLHGRWAQAKGGEGHSVLLLGEAGIGKSRIVRALLDDLADDRHLRLRYQCSPYHTDSMLWPMIQQIRYAADLRPEDSPGEARDKVRDLLAQAVDDPAEAVARIASLVGIGPAVHPAEHEDSPRRRHVRTLDALMAQVFGLAAQQPVLMIFEDLQWADSTSLEFVERIVKKTTTLPVLLLMTTRPPAPGSLMGSPDVTCLTFNRLRRGVASDLIRSVAGDRDLPGEVVSSIIDKAEGIPLYVEELTKAVVESGQLKLIGDRYVLDAPLADLAMPSSLHDSLVARLDRLAAVKEVAQVAACIGRDFDYPLLATIAWMDEDALRGAIDKLESAEIIVARGQPTEATYSFRHSLLRDAAHENMLMAERREVHARICEALTGPLADRAQSDPAELARHYIAAERPEEAIPLLREAARRAAAAGGYGEAVGQCRLVLDLLRRPPLSDDGGVRELEALLDLGSQVQILHGAGSTDAEMLFREAVELSERHERVRERFVAMWNLWRLENTRGNYAAAIAYADELVDLGNRIDDPEFMLQAHHACWTTAHCTGDLRTALNHALSARLPPTDRDKGLELFGGHDAGVCGLSTAAFASWLMGSPGDSEHYLAKASARAEQLGHPSTTVNSLTIVVSISFVRRDWATLGDTATRLNKLVEPEGLEDYQALTRFALGLCRFWTGGGEDALTEMNEALEHGRRVGRAFEIPMWEVLLGEALLSQDLAHDARTCAERTLSNVGSDGNIYESEARCLLGDANYKLGDVSTAEQEYKNSIETAQRQSARVFVLRAAVRLAGLYSQREDLNSARTVLQDIYRELSGIEGLVELDEAERLLANIDSRVQ